MSQTGTAARPLELADGLERAGGELGFYRELLDLLLEDVPLRLREVREAVAAGDAVRVARAAHAIKGAAANLSAVPLSEAAFRLECHGRAGRSAGLEEAVRAVEEELARIAQFVRTL